VDLADQWGDRILGVTPPGSALFFDYYYSFIFIKLFQHKITYANAKKRNSTSENFIKDKIKSFPDPGSYEYEQIRVSLCL